MNVVVIGLGSMGKRRIRLLNRMVDGDVCDLSVAGIDSSEERRKEAEDLYGIKTYASISDAMQEETYEAAVISTSPLSHAAIITECLNANLHVFTEINLVADGYEDNIKLAKEKGCVLFLSSTPMYRREMQYIKGVVAHNEHKCIYHYHVGQYLPEWHPWENYKNYFVGDKRSNGCRELFAIELPWLVDTFGDVKSVASIHKKISGLDLPYDDSYTVNIKHASGVIGNLSIDVVTPKGGRKLVLWGEFRDF